jgi:DNA-binding PadR family transcriptional regulator
MSPSHAFLGLLETQPRYGYELKQLYDVHFGMTQPIKFGQVYATLGRLRRDGLVDIAGVETGAGPDRKLYVITDEGVADLDRWVSEADQPAGFTRSGLFARAVVALMSGRSPDEVLDVQRSAHLAVMRDITKRKASADLMEALSCDFELLHLQADLKWIELAGQRAVRAKGTGK